VSKPALKTQQKIFSIQVGDKVPVIKLNICTIVLDSLKTTVYMLCKKNCACHCMFINVYPIVFLPFDYPQKNIKNIYEINYMKKEEDGEKFYISESVIISRYYKM